MGLVGVPRNAVQDLTPSHSGWECCLPNPHLTDWGTLAWKGKHMYTHMQIHLYVYVYFIYLLLSVQRYAKGKSETPPLPVFPFSLFFFFFFKYFLQNTEQMLRRVVEEEHPQRAEDSNSVCLPVFGWVSSRPEAPVRCPVRSDPGAAAGDRDSGNGAVPGIHILGRKPIPPIHPKTFEHGEEQFGI